MAPARTEIPSSGPIGAPTPTPSKANPVDFAVFPDGIKTSGQHAPLYDQLAPYSTFPKVISGPTLWHPSTYTYNPERWTHPLSSSEIAELSTAADALLSSSTPLTAISPSIFPLPTMAPFLRSMRAELLNGKGFILFKNFPVHEWGLRKSAVAYMGLGSYIGYPVSQNSKGHILGHVKDLGEDSTQIDKVRIYRTNARQFFHSDDADAVGLLCVARAEEGGESDIASSHLVWNTLQAERPDVAELLTQPIWYFDRKGEVSAGEEQWIRTAVFFLERGGQRRVYSKWDPYFVRSLSRFSDAGLIPPLSPQQEEAAQVLEETCNRLKLHMVLEVGDIQFLSNEHVFHARTAYRDHGPDSGMPRRHLMRLWLSTPEEEGGWVLPYMDSKDKKRGGIQVNDTPPVANLDAD
jgi:hypothetical protein